MTAPVPHGRHHYTYEEYLAYERDSELKHEFEAGEIFAMAGGSPRHSALASRISAAIENTRPSGCTAFLVKLASGATLDLSILYESLPH